MDKNITFSKVGAFVSGSSLMSNMVIFQDPIYLYLAILGGGVSGAGMAHELIKSQQILGIYKILGEIVKSLLFGTILTPMVFMLFLKLGNLALGKILGVDGVSMLNSFWFLASVLTSWYIIPVWSWFIKLGVKLVKERIDGK